MRDGWGTAILRQPRPPMNKPDKPVMDQLPKLSPVETIDLSGELWDGISPAELPPSTAAQIEELDRRMAEHEADPSSAIPAEEVPACLRARFE